MRDLRIFLFLKTIGPEHKKLRQIKTYLLVTLPALLVKRIEQLQYYCTAVPVGTCKGMDGVQRAAESLVKDVADSGPATQL